MNRTTRRTESTKKKPVLHLALELGGKEWKLAFAAEVGQRARLRTIRAADLADLVHEIARAKTRFGLPASARVVSCYEAGRDGFWLHRWLCAHGVENCIVDSSSIEVNRRARRAKTDRLDAQKLLSQLLRFAEGERKVWSVVRVPTVEQEDERQLSRELEQLKSERTAHCNRIQGLLQSQGIRLKVGQKFLDQLAEIVLWDGQPLPEGMRQRLLREAERLQGVQEQILQLGRQRRQRLKEASDATTEKLRQLIGLKAIGENSSWVFVTEFFGWRDFRNRRQIGALAGLAPQPYQSGESVDHTLGIGGGNRRLRSMADR